MGRAPSHVWKHFAVRTGNGPRVSTCNYCRKNMRSNASYLAIHLERCLALHSAAAPPPQSGDDSQSAVSENPEPKPLLIPKTEPMEERQSFVRVKREERDVGSMGRATRQQELLVNQLRLEVQRIEDRRQDVLSRLRDYRRVGLLTAQQVSYISNCESDHIVVESAEDVGGGVVQVSRNSPPATRTSAPFCPSVGSPVTWDSDQNDGSNHPTSGSASESNRSVNPAIDERAQLSFVQKLMESMDSNPVCVLCKQRFPDKKTLSCHMFGDKATGTPSSCPGSATRSDGQMDHTVTPTAGPFHAVGQQPLHLHIPPTAGVQNQDQFFVAIDPNAGLMQNDSHFQ